MQQDLRYLEPLLTPSHAKLVTDPAESDELARLCHESENEHIPGYISERGRVFALSLGRRGRFIYEGEITVDADYDWEPSGTPRVWKLSTTDKDLIVQDVRGLFLAQSLQLDAMRCFTGWRDRVVALIPEEVGPKEAKIFWTTAEGKIAATHTYRVMDAYATYAERVNDLAAEFGGSDKALHDRMAWPEETRQETGGMVTNIIQTWLLRGAAQAQLDQARGSLKLSLGSHSRHLQMRHDGPQPMALAELARSLYTDRPNLTRVAKAAESDPEIGRILKYAETGDLSLLRPRS
jgi:hypothetical protein